MSGAGSKELAVETTCIHVHLFLLPSILRSCTMNSSSSLHPIYSMMYVGILKGCESNSRWSYILLYMFKSDVSTSQKHPYIAIVAFILLRAFAKVMLRWFGMQYVNASTGCSAIIVTHAWGLNGEMSLSHAMEHFKPSESGDNDMWDSWGTLCCHVYIFHITTSYW